MNDIKTHFTLLKELERENQEIQEQLDRLMAEMESLQPELRSLSDWGPAGTRTKRFLELSERQNEIAAEIKLVSLAIENAKPSGNTS